MLHTLEINPKVPNPCLDCRGCSECHACPYWKDWCLDTDFNAWPIMNTLTDTRAGGTFAYVCPDHALPGSGIHVYASDVIAILDNNFTTISNLDKDLR